MKTKRKHRRKKMYSKRKKKYGHGKPISDKKWKKLMNSIKRIRSKFKRRLLFMKIKEKLTKVYI